MNKKKSLSVLVALVFAWLAISSIVYADGVVVVTNKGVAAGVVKAEMIKKIYSGHVTKWPDNQAIIVSVMEGSDAHKEFLKTYVNKSDAQFSSTWKKMMFTGQASYPKNFNNAQSLVDFVAKTPGAIGYVDAEAKTDEVNVVK
jgi:ABC-type phosphate transport system substrate-binding protein